MRCTCSSSSACGIVARFHRCLESLVVEESARLFVVEARGRSLLRAVRSAPVREHEAGKLPVLLQHVREQPLVLAGKVADSRGCRSTSPRPDGPAPRRSQRPADRSRARPACSMVMLTELRPLSWSLKRVVLDVADDVLRLRSLNQLRHQRSGQNRVFAQDTQTCGRCAVRA